MTQISQFYQYATNLSQKLIISFDGVLLIENSFRKIRKIYISDLAMYIINIKQKILRYKIFYNSVQGIYISKFSSQLLIQSNKIKFIIDKFGVRQTIIDIIVGVKPSVKVQYVADTILETKMKELQDQDLKNSVQIIDMIEVNRDYQRNSTNLIVKKNLQDYFLKDIILKNQLWSLYFAKNEKYNNNCTLKVYEKKLLSENAFLLNFIVNERKNLQSIVSPYIPSLVRAFTSKSYICFQFEYFNGVLLSNILKRQKFKYKQIKMLIAQLAVAIGQIHQCGLAGIDLSPSNIFINFDGHILFSNLGNCCQINSKYIPSGHKYRSPESFINCVAKQSMDWWSLGQLLYQIVTQRPLFQNLSQQQLKKQLLSQDPILPISQKQSQDRIMSLILLLIQKNPNKRIGSKNDYHQILHLQYFKELQKKQLTLKKNGEILKPKIELSKQKYNQLIDGEDYQLEETAINLIKYSRDLDDNDQDIFD